jgi:hypothetical protein
MESALIQVVFGFGMFLVGMAVGHWGLPPARRSSFRDSKRRDKQARREKQRRERSAGRRSGDGPTG